MSDSVNIQLNLVGAGERGHHRRQDISLQFPGYDGFLHVLQRESINMANIC